MAFVNFKIDKRVQDDILQGRSRGNKLVPTMKKEGNRVAKQAKENTMTARNNQAAPYNKKNRKDSSGLLGGKGVRGIKGFSGGAGRYKTGKLANSFVVKDRITGGAPEIRVGSSSPIFEFHEFGTSKTGWGRGILPGHMLKDAITDTLGRATSRVAGRSVYKAISKPYSFLDY
jgi:hypothetical protein